MFPHTKKVLWINQDDRDSAPEETAIGEIVDWMKQWGVQQEEFLVETRPSAIAADNDFYDEFFSDVPQRFFLRRHGEQFRIVAAESAEDDRDQIRQKYPLQDAPKFDGEVVTIANYGWRNPGRNRRWQGGWRMYLVKDGEMIILAKNLRTADFSAFLKRFGGKFRLEGIGLDTAEVLHKLTAEMSSEQQQEKSLRKKAGTFRPREFRFRISAR